MLRLVILVALLAAAAYVLSNRAASNPLSPELTRHEVTVRSRHNEVRFQRSLPLDDAYMIFGGNASEQGGHFTNVLLSGLAQRHVSLISQRYPDFTQCRSPGAASAKQAIEHMALIGRDGRARNTLLEALRLHEEHLQRGGERTCVSLRGQRLQLTSARALSTDVDLTDAVRRGHGQTDFYLIDEAAIVPCSNLTR
jgi:hypothetical protein